MTSKKDRGDQFKKRLELPVRAIRHLLRQKSPTRQVQGGRDVERPASASGASVPTLGVVGESNAQHQAILAERDTGIENTHREEMGSDSVRIDMYPQERAASEGFATNSTQTSSNEIQKTIKMNPHDLDSLETSSVVRDSSEGTVTKGVVSMAAKSSLAALYNVTRLVPNLQSAAGVIMECIKNVPMAVANRSDYEEIASDISKTISTLEKHLGELTTQQMAVGLEATINELKLQGERIKAKQLRNVAKAYVDAEEDAEDIVRCYRQLEVMLRQLQSDVILSVWRITMENLSLAKESLNLKTESRMDKLLQAATAARYNSGALSHLRVECTPGTRETLLQGLRDWASDPKGSTIYWMSGMAGTGKTTIAYSLCKRLESSRQLGASFFCSGALLECSDVNRIVPTIARQLSQLCLPYKEALFQALNIGPDIVNLNLATQFEKLVCDPLIRVKDTLPAGLLVVVIDALDECSQRQDAMRMLDALIQFADHLPIKFFVTCRPDSGLLNKMSPLGAHTISLYHLHNVEQSLVRSDIERYLHSNLAPIGVTTAQLKALTKQTGELFIYASTIVKYIAPHDTWCDHKERLEEILDIDSGSNSSLLGELDTLYTTILATALERGNKRPVEKSRVLQVLQTVICSKEALSLTALAHILEYRDTEQARCAIESLRAVLNIDEATGLVSVLHASFPEFLASESRSGKFYCDLQRCNHEMAARCFGVMAQLLRFNICGLESSYILDADVPSLSIRISEVIPMHLEYACRHWSDHMRCAGIMAIADSSLGPMLSEFLRSRVLFWIEVTNLLQANQASIKVLFEGLAWVRSAGLDKELVALYQDAMKLLTVLSGSLVHKSTPHIYVSLMALWDKTGPIWSCYGPRLRGLANAKGLVVNRRASQALVTWKTTRNARSMAVSPNGRVIATGSLFGEVCLWETHTGRQISAPVRGHTNRVTCLAFSPDGASFASTSWDGAICIWDAQNGEPVGNPMKGPEWAQSICYAPDGQRIASGSGDLTVRIWDVSTGLQLICIKEHTQAVWSVAYSPDGNRVVSGSKDNTICIWDAQTGILLLGPLTGHTDKIYSVAYSPNGLHIVSGSEDQTVRIWDAGTGIPEAMPFKGHNASVTSVSYSPDSSCIVSGSSDGTVRVWDGRSGSTIAGPFNGYNSYMSPVFILDGTQVLFVSSEDKVCIWDVEARAAAPGVPEVQTSPVNSVAFSPDGMRIVSGSDNGTISIWDTLAGNRVIGPLVAHSQWVRSVAYSPCGTRVASASGDKTVCMWDTNTGSLVGDPYIGHEDSVGTIVFSPDGSRVASGSDDKTIHIWDIDSRDLVAQPFQGHSAWVRSISFSPEGQHIASISDDCTMRIWNIETGSSVGNPFKAGTWAIAYSPDGTRLAFDYDDHTIAVCDTGTGEIVTGPCKGHSEPVFSICFSPDSQYIVSGSADQSIRVWNAHSGDQVTCVSFAHTGWVRSLSFSHDGKYIASGSEDGSIRVWDASTITSTTANDSNWEELDKEGWAVHRDSTRLFWVPDDLRNRLKWPQNVAVVHPHGAWELDLTGAYVGTAWKQCYI